MHFCNHANANYIRVKKLFKNVHFWGTWLKLEFRKMSLLCKKLIAAVGITKCQITMVIIDVNI